MGTQEGKVVICSLVVVIYIYTWKGRIYLPPTFFWATQSSKFVEKGWNQREKLLQRVWRFSREIIGRGE